MTDYPSNSNKLREEAVEEKRVNKVIEGGAKIKKKSAVKRFLDGLAPGDDQTIGSYILSEICVPLIKKGISEAVDSILYPGGSNRYRGVTRNESYTSYYNRPNSGRRSSERVESARRYDRRETVIIPSRGEAEKVLIEMEKCLDHYGLVRVTDFNEMVGITGNWTDHRYGWTDLMDARIERLRDGSGFEIKLPRPLPID